MITLKNKMTNINIMCFRHFIRINYSEFTFSDDDIDTLNSEFTQYLSNKCTDDMLKIFTPTDMIDVINKVHHPLYVNGYHPAFILHFQNFIKETMDSSVN